MLPRSPLNPTGEEPQDEDAAAIQGAQRELQWLAPMMDHPSFQRFWNMIAAQVMKLSSEGLDVSKPVEARNNAAQRHDELRKWHRWPFEQREKCLQALKTNESRQEAQAAQPAPAP